MGDLLEGLSDLMESSGCGERKIHNIGLGADAGWEPRALRPSPSLPPPGAPLGGGRLEKAGAAAAKPGAAAVAVMEGRAGAQLVAWAVVPGRVNLPQP